MKLDETDETAPLTAEDCFAYDRMMLFLLINIARAADDLLHDWEPLPKAWRLRFWTLKAAIDKGEIDAIKRGEVATKITVVELRALKAFLAQTTSAQWDWLRGLCDRW